MNLSYEFGKSSIFFRLMNSKILDFFLSYEFLLLKFFGVMNLIWKFLIFFQVINLCEKGVSKYRNIFAKIETRFDFLFS